MKLIGLTGGIGMGKSACAGLLRKRSVPVIDTDDLSRALTETGQPALAEITRIFGADMLDESGRLRRDILAARVFDDASALKQLEAILHPRITAAWREQVQQWREQGRSHAVVVIPLLFETQGEASFDTVVCVACSVATQRERLQMRGWSEAETRRRNAAQLPIEEKLARAHRVLWSEGSLAALDAQLARMLA